MVGRFGASYLVNNVKTGPNNSLYALPFENLAQFVLWYPAGCTNGKGLESPKIDFIQPESSNNVGLAGKETKLKMSRIVLQGS